MTSAEVCKYLNISRKTFFRLLKVGRISGVRVGRQWRFRKADLDRYLLGGYQHDHPRLFKKEVLEKYKINSDKYNLRMEQGFGWLAESGIQLPPEMPGRESKTLFFHILKLPEVNVEVIVVMQYALIHQLPQAELEHWLKYEIRQDRGA